MKSEQRERKLYFWTETEKLFLKEHLSQENLWTVERVLQSSSEENIFQ